MHGWVSSLLSTSLNHRNPVDFWWIQQDYIVVIKRLQIYPVDPVDSWWIVVDFWWISGGLLVDSQLWWIADRFLVDFWWI